MVGSRAHPCPARGIVTRMGRDAARAGGSARQRRARSAVRPAKAGAAMLRITEGHPPPETHAPAPPGERIACGIHPYGPCTRTSLPRARLHPVALKSFQSLSLRLSPCGHRWCRWACGLSIFEPGIQMKRSRPDQSSAKLCPVSKFSPLYLAILAREAPKQQTIRPTAPAQNHPFARARTRARPAARRAPRA